MAEHIGHIEQMIDLQAILTAHQIKLLQSQRGKHRVFDSSIKLFAYIETLLGFPYIIEWFSDTTAKTKPKNARRCTQGKFTANPKQYFQFLW